MTCAPGTTAPCWSVTLPTIELEMFCARRPPHAKAKTTKITLIRFFISCSLLCWSPFWAVLLVELTYITLYETSCLLVFGNGGQAKNFNPEKNSNPRRELPLPRRHFPLRPFLVRHASSGQLAVGRDRPLARPQRDQHPAQNQRRTRVVPRRGRAMKHHRVQKKREHHRAGHDARRKH